MKDHDLVPAVAEMLEPEQHLGRRVHEIREQDDEATAPDALRQLVQCRPESRLALRPGSAQRLEQLV